MRFDAGACSPDEQTNMRNAWATIRSVESSPDSAAVFPNHWLPCLTTERLLELRYVHDDPVDPVFARRMGIGESAYAQILRAFVLAHPLCETDEEALLRRKAITIL